MNLSMRDRSVRKSAEVHLGHDSSDVMPGEVRMSCRRVGAVAGYE